VEIAFAMACLLNRFFERAIQRLLPLRNSFLLRQLILTSRQILAGLKTADLNLVVFLWPSSTPSIMNRW
ncbi:MAG TPA: hypothetical protein VLJ79_02825, partial [Candidatus Binatia bacterium]|nr:hypothetical protein [Candidatus Binatia bacterium]